MVATIDVNANYPFQSSTASTEGDWCRWQKNYLVNGVVVPDGSYSNPFLVTQSAVPANTVTVSAGRAIVEGVFCELGGGAVLSVPANVTGSTRLDLVTLTLDWNQHKAYVQYITGGVTQPSLFLGSPPLSNLYQFPLALVSAPNGFVTIVSSNIQDARVLLSGVSPANGAFAASLPSAVTLNVPALSYMSRPQTLFYQVSLTNAISTIQPVAGTTANIPIGTVLQLAFLSGSSTGGVITGGNIALKSKRFAPFINNAEIALRWNGSSWQEVYRNGGYPNGAYVTAASGTVLTSGAHTPINWDNASPGLDTEGMWSGGVNQRLTCQTTGWYRFNAVIDIQSNATNSRQIELVHNTAGAIAQQGCLAENTASTKLAISTDYPMNAGEYMVVQAFQDSGGNLTAGGTPHFSAFRIGD